MDDQFFSFETEGSADFWSSEQIDLSTVSNFDVNTLPGLPAFPMSAMEVRIPAVFHSLYDGPFSTCLVCDRELLKSLAEYVIVRSFQGDEPITEYAICVGCNDRFWGKVSGETKASIAEEFQRNVDHDWRRSVLLSGANLVDFDLEPWIAECLLTGKPRAACDTHQLLAKCRGPYLTLWDMPWMRSGESLRRTRSMWSRHSQDIFDGFVEEHLGPTPCAAKETPLPAFAASC